MPSRLRTSGRPILWLAACWATLGIARVFLTVAVTVKTAFVQRLYLDVAEFQAGHLVGVVDHERGVAVAEFLDHEGRRHALRLLDEAADLDVSIDADASTGFHSLNARAEEELVIGEELVSLAVHADGPPGSPWPPRRRGCAEQLLGVPELVGERENPEMLVGPVHEPAVDVV